MKHETNLSSSEKFIYAVNRCESLCTQDRIMFFISTILNIMFIFCNIPLLMYIVFVFINTFALHKCMSINAKEKCSHIKSIIDISEKEIEGDDSTVEKVKQMFGKLSIDPNIPGLFTIINNMKNDSNDR